MKTSYNFQNQGLIYREHTQKSNYISPFIEGGKFLTHKPTINPTYSIDNFEYETDCNNEIIIIGRGGYGKLYLAKNIIDKKEYAIKYVSKKKMQSVGVDFSIIKREIDIHIRISHPRIIKLLSYLEDKNNFYLALEYAPNGTLYQLIQQKKGMCENEAFHYFIQVASAIHFLHINGYAHRDIKPENILLDSKGGIKLCDFGWCVNVAKGERTTFCGTYEYMAPEMINDEFYDMGIDIWSLGVLLYEMLHGYSPFRANRFIKDAKKAQVEIFINIKNNNYTIHKKISEECIDLIDKLLTTDTAKRIKIEELFQHPWVVNKETEYFPLLKRFRESKKNSMPNSVSNSIRKIEKDSDSVQNLNIKNIQKYEIKFNKDILEKKANRNNINNNNEKKERQNNNMSNMPKQINNKSYCYVYTKNISNNNGIHFIQEQNGKKQIKEISNQKRDKENDNNKNKENKRYCKDYNKLILNENNGKELTNYNINKDKNDISNIVKKDIEAKNNFIYQINTKRKKINLPKVVRTEKKAEENKILKVDPLESQEIKRINIKTNNYFNNISSKEEKNDQRNIFNSKTDKKLSIREQRQDLDDYIKGQKEINVLNLKMQQIKEKKEIVISKLRKIEEKKRREESLQKMYESQKSSTSYDYYSKSRALKNTYSFLNNKPKKDIGSYTIKTIKKDDDAKKNKYSLLREKLKEKRAYSYQHILTDKLLEHKIRNLIKEKRNIIKTNNILNKNTNSINNENINYKNINNNGEDDISGHKDHFKRFRKKVVLLKKRNNLKINTGNNLYKPLNSYENNTSSFNKILNNHNNYLKTDKTNNSIQNIVYNTFYNLSFKNIHKNSNLCDNKNHHNLFSNNKLNNINDKKDIKSISSEKTIYKFKNIFKLVKPKNNEYSNNINSMNKENKILNFGTERKNRNLYKSSISFEGIQNKDLKNKLSFAYNNKNNSLKSNAIRSFSNKKGIIS